MSTSGADPADVLRPLRRVRQVRQFTEEPVSAEVVQAIADVARWSGSSMNNQPWRFIVIREAPTLRDLASRGLPQTRSLETAAAAIASCLSSEKGRAVSDAFDDGRAAERMLVAASKLGLGAGIAWIRSDVRDALREILGLPDHRFVRTIVALGYPSPRARRPKSAKGEARLPREEVVFSERWPDSKS